MLNEPTIVPSALIWPHTCLCGESRGPFLDLGYDILNRHQFVCRKCSRSIAKPWGFSQGKRMDELVNAAKTLEQREREIAERDDYVRDLELKLKAETVRVEELLATVEHLEGEVARRDLIARNTQETLAQLAPQVAA